uniref:DDE Tnp4 domain-containing protein n=1 Tax=Sinocyclocheilus grahami TaxID=75366 RepID=A0A672KKR7_SINGR
MSCPFLREQPVAEGARIIRRAFRINRVLRHRQDPLAQCDSVLFERYRFSCEVQTVCIALRIFASGTLLYTIGDAENLAKSAVCRAIRKVYLALKQFLGVFVVFPSHLRPQVVKQSFFAIAGFPNVIGAIDCTHIHIKAPPGPNEGDFVNRKGVHRINMVCDSMCHVTNVEAKWPGSVHDSRIFRESCLCTLFERGDYDGILVGDGGYTFGQLKGRFQCLKSLRVAPDRACNIIVACAVLHNIATIRKERTPVVEV